MLQHVPLGAIDDVIAGAHELLAAEHGCSIHAVDHVLAGWGADSHREGLERIVSASGLDAGELDGVLRAMDSLPPANRVALGQSVVLYDLTDTYVLGGGLNTTR